MDKEAIELKKLWATESLKTCKEGIEICKFKIDTFTYRLNNLEQQKKYCEDILNDGYMPD